MTDIEWGAEIAVNGVRPEWLDGNFSYRSAFGVIRWYGPVCGYSGWTHVGAIRLPADHPYYLATSRGFIYWPGGESAPADWGTEFILRNGSEWSHPSAGPNWTGSGTDIIGYRKRTEQPAPAIAPELVERMVRLVRLCSDVICAGPYADEARAILAELEPDPDLTLAKSIVGDAEAIALAIKAARENGRG